MIRHLMLILAALLLAAITWYATAAVLLAFAMLIDVFETREMVHARLHGETQ